MDYLQTLQYLYSQLPMFHRVGAAAYKADLNNTIAICNLLNNAQNNFKTIHIAGTNGKGSTSHMIASILQEAGYKTGLYTSPHLKDYRERIKINGKVIAENYVTAFVNKYKQDFDIIKPSFFEMTVGLAFNYFKDENVDIAVIETGLGGRLDSTNIINPLVSVITNISYDHTNLLGDTLEKIAYEKAGIIKNTTPVVIGETQKETEKVFIDKANELNSKIYFADKRYEVNNFSQENIGTKLYSKFELQKTGYPENHTFYCELLGFYQQKNIKTVLQTIELLSCIGLPINKKHIYDGLLKVVENTGLMGRWQILSEKPLAVCDTGHNEAGITEVINQISKISFKKLHFVLGVVNDKDIDKILKLLPVNAVYYFCKADIPRGLDVDILNEKALKVGLYGQSYNSVAEAYQKALSNAAENDFIFVGGSNFVVAEVV